MLLSFCWQFDIVALLAADDVIHVALLVAGDVVHVALLAAGDVDTSCSPSCW
jgi:hypothetical protein